MSKTSKIILVTIIATLILLGLGYAAITNITLNIAGSASASADQANFKVRFVGTPEVSDSVAATAEITGDQTATINVQGLTSAGQFVTATYEIKNESQDLSADLNVATTNSNKEYFTISSQLAKSSLTAGETTTALVTVKLTKTPIDGDISANIGVNLTAMPVQPGEEGTSRGTNDFSSTPISRELNEYGFYYGVAYTTVSEGGWFEGESTSMVVYEDGTIEQYWNDNLATYYSADEVELSEKLIKFNGMEIKVSDDGYTLINGSTISELNESFMDTQEEYTGKLNNYGFYYDVPYVWGFFGSTVTYIFHEDSTFSYYVGGSYLERGNTTYSNGTITPGSFIPLIICKNGARLLHNNSNFAYKISKNIDYYDHVYITRNTTTGEYEYSDKLALVHKENDMYAMGNYIATYKKGSSSDYWKIELLTDASIVPDGFEITDRVQKSYQNVWKDFNNVNVTDLSNLYAGCTNLLYAPSISENMENISGMFDGCTSLKSAPIIYENVTNVTNAFRGCTSLEGEIQIDSNNITAYEGCFEGVDMSKITLTGSASDEIKDLLGKTGLNYTPLIQE